MKRLPTTVITGFLGAGKTTVLRNLLLKSNKRLAIIVNEFGSVGLDGDLIRSCGFCPEEELEGRLIELNNGCLCCTVQDDFLPTMEQILERENHLDGIVIETSGLALPRPLLQALDWPSIRRRVHVNGVITLVDGEALAAGSPVSDLLSLEHQRQEDQNLDHFTSIDELFCNQLISADLVIISRADKLNNKQISSIKSQIENKVRPGTSMLAVSNGEIDHSIILGISNHFNDTQQLNSHDKEHNHHSHVKIIGSSIRFEGRIDQNELENLLPILVRKHQVVRLKGRVWLEGKMLPLQLQMVGPRLNSWFEAVPSSAWHPISGFGVDLVVLALKENADSAIGETITKLIKTVPL